MRKPQRNERHKRPYRDMQAERVLAFVDYYVAETGAFPTKARIARQLGWPNPHRVFPVLERLAARKKLVRVREGRRIRFELRHDKQSIREDQGGPAGDPGGHSRGRIGEADG